MVAVHVSMEVDLTADAAYIRFQDSPVARTLEVTEAVQVDLDTFGMAVGVEVLELNADIPFQRLITEFHVPSEAIVALRQIRPSVSGFMTLSQGSDGSMVPSGLVSST